MSIGDVKNILWSAQRNAERVLTVVAGMAEQLQSVTYNVDTANISVQEGRQIGYAAALEQSTVNWNLKQALHGSDRPDVAELHGHALRLANEDQTGELDETVQLLGALAERIEEIKGEAAVVAGRLERNAGAVNQLIEDIGTVAASY